VCDLRDELLDRMRHEHPELAPPVIPAEPQGSASRSSAAQPRPTGSTTSRNVATSPRFKPSGMRPILRGGNAVCSNAFERLA